MDLTFLKYVLIPSIQKNIRELVQRTITPGYADYLSHSIVIKEELHIEGLIVLIIITTATAVVFT